MGLCHRPQCGLLSARPTYFTSPLNLSLEYAPAYNLRTPSLLSVLCFDFLDFPASSLCCFVLKENPENLCTKLLSTPTFQHCNLRIDYVLLLPTQLKNDAPESVKTTVWYINFEKLGVAMPFPDLSLVGREPLFLHPTLWHIHSLTFSRLRCLT